MAGNSGRAATGTSGLAAQGGLVGTTGRTIIISTSDSVALVELQPPLPQGGVASRGVTNLRAILKPAGAKIGVPGSSDRIRIVKGGLKDAEDMFLDLAIKGKGKDITPKGFAGMVVEFPDGGIIRFRPTSTSGPPTIDVVIKYLGIDEIKFIP